MGVDHAGSIRSRRRQVEPRPAGRSGSSASPSWPGVAGLRAGGWFRRRRCGGGDVAAADARAHRVAGRRGAAGRRWCSTSRTCSPTPPSSTGAITNRRVIAVGRVARAVHLPPGATRSRCSATTCARNVVAKLARDRGRDVSHVIPNFVDTDAHPAGRRMTRVPRRARHRRRAGRALRRQRRLLAIARARRRSRPPAARRDVPHQRRRRRRGRSCEPSAAGLANVRFAGYQPVERLARCSPPATSTSCRCAPGSASRQRPVEDVLEPGRRPAGRGLDRSRQRDAAAPRRGRRRHRGGARRRRRLRGRRRAAASTIPARPPRWASGAARGSSGAASPAAVARPTSAC